MNLGDIYEDLVCIQVKLRNYIKHSGSSICLDAVMYLLNEAEEFLHEQIEDE